MNNGFDTNDVNQNNNVNPNANPNVNYAPAGDTPRTRSDALGVISMIFGIISAVCCCCGALSAVVGATAIVLACLSRAKLGRFSGTAITGLVCGIIGFLIAAVAVVVSNVVMSNPDVIEMIESIYADAGISIDLGNQ